MKRRQKKSRLGFHILDIPSHILCDIMFNLPASSIARCCCVCTTFRDILTNSTFQQLYFSRGPTSCVVLSGTKLLSCIESCALTETPHSNYDESSCMASYRKQSFSSSTYHSGIDPIHTQKSIDESPLIKRTRFITFRTKIDMHLVNSSKGLLCLRSCYEPYSPSLYCICNPLLGEILSVPSPPSVTDEALCFSAFGFDPESKHYKILRLVFDVESNRMEAEVYQSVDDTWRVIENAPTVRPDSAFDPSLNGALHWVTLNPNVSKLICCFDWHSNQFKTLAPPSHFDDTYLLKISSISVGVLKGCLCLCYVNGDAKFETWVMKKYGQVESWTKAFSIDINYYCGLRLQDKHRPIGFSSSGDMWMKDDSDSDLLPNCLVSYSAKASVFRQIDIGGLTPSIEATPHVFSFVSLKDMVKLRDTRLKIEKLSPN